jgi:hypothetical protein
LAVNAWDKIGEREKKKPESRDPAAGLGGMVIMILLGTAFPFIIAALTR